MATIDPLATPLAAGRRLRVVGARRAPGPARIAVIGGGFTGVLTAIHLLWRCRRGERVYLVERRGSIGPGVAYATPAPEHLLNVRAENASAFGDEPDHFVRWLARLPAEQRARAGVETEAGMFVRRLVYGGYVQELLRDAMVRAGGSENLFIIADEAVALHERGHGLDLVTGMGRVFQVDAAVVATGVLPPDAGERAGFIGNPWTKAATDGLVQDEPVLLIGSALTMVDVLLAMRATGFRGTVHAISRRGLLPRRHAASQPWPGLRLGPADRASLRALVAAVRREVARAAKRGVSWHAVLDALRPRLMPLWIGLSAEDQARFLRHVRPWWDVHRHRLAPPVHDTIAAEITAGTLELTAGRITAIEPVPGRRAMDVTWTARARGGSHRLRVQRVVSCTGPGAGSRLMEEALLRQLLTDGLASPDPHRLGLATSPKGALLAAGGRVSARLFAAGPITRGTFWETTSVPDLREQVEAVAVGALKAARRVASGRDARPSPAVATAA